MPLLIKKNNEPRHYTEGGLFSTYDPQSEANNSTIVEAGAFIINNIFDYKNQKSSRSKYEEGR